MRAPGTTPPIAITGVGRVPRDPERFLGKRGFKFLSPATRYALAAAQLALDDAGLAQAGPYAADAKGVFMGTNFAVHGVVEAMDDVVLAQGAQALQAIETPNFSVNLPASYISQRWGFLAFNVTLTNMLVAGVEAVMLGAQSIRDERAQLVLAGAAEGAIPAGAGALLGGGPSDGAGCLLALEALPAARARGARTYAQVGAAALFFVAPAAAASAHSWQPHEQRLRRHLDGLLAAHGTLRLGLFDLDCALVQRLNACALRHFEERHVRVHGSPAGTCSAAQASAAPLLWLAETVAEQEAALLLAASPQGHVALLSLAPADTDPRGGVSTEKTLPVAIT